MKKENIIIGKTYAVKGSGKIAPVRLDSESPHGGWNGTNLHSKRQVRIRTAAKLRREYGAVDKSAVRKMLDTAISTSDLREREVCGDECAVVGCPYAGDNNSKYCAYHNKPFPSVAEVCELLDATVLSDMGALSNDENDMRHKSIVAIGWNAEPSAGIRYGTVTNWFDSMEQLDEFCKRHIERFRAVPADAPAPDATGWE